MNILITGATGFIGRRLIQDLLTHCQHQLSVLSRQSNPQLPAEVTTLQIDAINGNTDYTDQLHNIDVVIHLAARVHHMGETNADSYPVYKTINVDGTRHLAKQAAKAGVKRFIYLSSIKVNGESTQPGEPFTADDPAAPTDPYAVSKHEAELALISLAQTSPLEYVIIRPPLVYGPGVKANFHNLLAVVSKGIPLPLGSIDNRRSLVCIDNLVSLIRCCIDHPSAANQIFLVSDDNDLSSTQLLHSLATAMNRSDRLIPCPTSLLAMAAKLFGKGDIATRLLSNLQVDISKTKRRLGWQPVISQQEGLRQTAQAYLEQLK